MSHNYVVPQLLNVEPFDSYESSDGTTERQAMGPTHMCVVCVCRVCAGRVCLLTSYTGWVVWYCMRRATPCVGVKALVLNEGID